MDFASRLDTDTKRILREHGELMMMICPPGVDGNPRRLDWTPQSKVCSADHVLYNLDEQDDSKAEVVHLLIVTMRSAMRIANLIKKCPTAPAIAIRGILKVANVDDARAIAAHIYITLLSSIEVSDRVRPGVVEGGTYRVVDVRKGGEVGTNRILAILAPSHVVIRNIHPPEIPETTECVYIDTTMVHMRSSRLKWSRMVEVVFGPDAIMGNWHRCLLEPDSMANDAHITFLLPPSPPTSLITMFSETVLRYPDASYFIHLSEPLVSASVLRILMRNFSTRRRTGKLTIRGAYDRMAAIDVARVIGYRVSEVSHNRVAPAPFFDSTGVHWSSVPYTFTDIDIKGDDETEFVDLGIVFGAKSTKWGVEWVAIN